MIPLRVQEKFRTMHLSKAKPPSLLERTAMALHKLALVSAMQRAPHLTYTALLADEALIAISLIQPTIPTLVSVSARLAVHPTRLHPALLSLAEQHLVTIKGTKIHLTSKGIARAHQRLTIIHAVLQQLDRFETETLTELYTMTVTSIRDKQRGRIINPTQLCVACTYFEPFAHLNKQAPHHCHLTDEPFSGPIPTTPNPRTLVMPMKKTRHTIRS